MPSEKKNIMEITSGTIARFILFGLLLVFLYLIRDIIAIILLSIVVASAARPAAKWFQNYHIPRVLGVLIVYLIAFGILGIAFYLVVPPLFFEVSDFLSSNHSSFSELPSKIIPGFFDNNEIPSSVSGILEEFSSTSEKFLSQLTQGFFKTVTVIFGGIVSFVLIVIISFYLSVQEGGIERFLRVIAPASYEQYVVGLWERSQRKIGRWLSGQLLLGLLVGSFVFIGLTILRVKYALSLAILSAVFELIPVFGPVLAAVPAVILGLIQAPWLGLAILILYVFI